MGPKKAPKPKLTAEEKKQLKLQKKLEKQRLAALLEKQRKHDHLTREINYGNLTLKRHEKKWRRMLLDIAVPRMKEELEFAWHNFERVVDAKDFKISLLLDELDEAEEQYLTNIRLHVEHIDRLIQMFHDRLKEMKDDNKRTVDEMKECAEKEVETIKLTHQENEEYLKTMLYCLDLARKEQEKNVRGDYLSKVDEENAKYGDTLQRLRADLESQFSNMWDDTEEFLTNYKHQTAERKKGYEELREQDDSMHELIKSQLSKIKKNYDYIKNLKQRYNNLYESREQKISDLTQEKQYFADAFNILKTRLVKDRQIDEEHLTLLTVKSSSTISHLRELTKKGEKILSLAAVCRKLETQKEKILAFPIYPEDAETEEKEAIEFGDLFLFWKRVAAADASRYSINEEREFLKRENFILQARIHRFCECLDCPSFPPIENRRKTQRINIIDGKLMMQNYQKHNA